MSSNILFLNIGYINYFNLLIKLFSLYININISIAINDSLKVRVETRRVLMEMLVWSVQQPQADLAYLLCAFDLHKPIHKTQMQDPGSWLRCFGLGVGNLVCFLVFGQF